VLIILKTAPSGLSCRNSKAAVSYSINDFLMYKSKTERRHRIINVNLLSVANNDELSELLVIGFCGCEDKFLFI